MSVTIRNRWNNEPIGTIKDTDSVREAVIRLVRQGVSLRDANLTGADLTRANLTGANLTDANLTRADLTDANLTRADLTRANLTGANLTDANLTRADLTRANLTDADLTDANLTGAENDFYAILSRTPAEVPALIAALEQGKVNGSTYSDGQCGCLIGTLAMAAGADKSSNEACSVVHGVQGDSSRPAERLFLAIRRGDTPATNPVAKIVHGWATGWLERMRAAFGVVV